MWNASACWNREAITNYLCWIIDQSIYRPAFPLNQIIETIWVAKADAFDVSASHHAALFTELIFNYGDQFQVEGENTESFVSLSGHYIISGLKTSPFHTITSGKYLNVGFILKPHYYGILLERFADQSMQQLSDFLFEKLIEPEAPNFKKVESTLVKFFGLIDIDPHVSKFERHISPELMRNGALQDFSNSTSISRKSFIEKFKKLYTLTPSEYLRLKQVNYATELIQRHPKASLTQVGLESGFYDQSHFIRVFKKHHGCTPKQFQKNQS